MEPLPATAQALQWLAHAGDERIGPAVMSVCDSVVTVAPLAEAMSITFLDEDLTFALVRPPPVPAHTLVPPVVRSSLELTFSATLSLTAVVGIYSGRVDAFANRVRSIESSLGAVPGSGVLDADLAFDAARRAALAPARIRGHVLVGTAVGLLVAAQGFTVEQAETWLEHQVRTSGRTELEVASTIVAAHRFPVEAPLATDGQELPASDDLGQS